jgi:hypothetical protein
MNEREHNTVQILEKRVGDLLGKTYRQIYDDWSSRPTKKGTPERIRAKAALALARLQEDPGEKSEEQARIEVKFPG